MITRDELRQMMPLAGKRVDTFLGPLNDSMLQFDISTPERIAAYLAQLAHESGELYYVHELASGEDYDTGPKAAALGNTPEADGDGQLHKGAGLIQITGTFNQNKCADWFGVAHDEVVEWLQTAKGASLSAGWFWFTHKLNQLADQRDMRGITKVINGGYTHLDRRLAYYKNNLAVLGCLA